MKRRFLYPLLAVLPMAVIAQTYNLVIHTKSGEAITVPTEDIEQMDFEEIALPGGQLRTPTLSYEKLSDNSFRMSWTSVQGADGYCWVLDGNTTSFTYQLSYTLQNLSEGTHTFMVQALAETDSEYKDSEYASVTFTVGAQRDDDSMLFLVGNYTHDSARISFFPGNAESYRVALIPASTAVSDSDIIDVVNGLSGDEVEVVTSVMEKTFSGLAPETSYIVAAVPSDKADTVYCKRFTTEAKGTQGTKGEVFPPGVSKSGGFVDVDKVGDTVYGPDNDLCWACVAAEMSQWWIDDYRHGTGTEYPFQYPLPAESLYYTSSIMDVISQAYYHQAGDVRNTLVWFFAGEPYPENYFINDVCGFNLDYQYVKGGFMGMSRNEFARYYDHNTVVDLFSGMTSDEMKAKFSDQMLGWLRHGPVYLCLSGNHAISAWGAEYVVQADGSKLVTKLYVAENGVTGANLRNTLQDAPVSYTDFTNKTNYPWIMLSTIFDGGTSSSGRLGVFTALRSWNSIHGE